VIHARRGRYALAEPRDSAHERLEPMAQGTRDPHKRRQINLWLTEADIDFLRELAREREQSASALLRHAISMWRRTRAVPSDREHPKLVSKH